jgi:hypothetical protein
MKTRINERRVAWFASAFALTLLVTGMAKAAGTGGPITPEQVSSLLVTKMPNPPVIDGTIDATEWREAVAVSGVIAFHQGLLLPRPSTFFLGWDEKHLYMAARSYVRPGWKPRIRDGRSDGMAFVFDEGLELVFIPQLPRMPETVLDWGMNREDVAYHSYWRNPHVQASDKNTLVSMWQLPDRILLGVFNYDNNRKKHVTLTLDLASLGITKKLKWQDFVRAHTIWRANDEDPDARLNSDGTALSVRELRPHTLRLISVRKY